MRRLHAHVTQCASDAASTCAELVRCSQTAGWMRSGVPSRWEAAMRAAFTFVLRLRINRAMGRGYVRSRPWRSGAKTDHVRRGTSTRMRISPSLDLKAVVTCPPTTALDRLDSPFDLCLGPRAFDYFHFFRADFFWELGINLTEFSRIIYIYMCEYKHKYKKASILFFRPLNPGPPPGAASGFVVLLARRSAATRPCGRRTTSYPHVTDEIAG
jgi:hypothetical protein